MFSTVARHRCHPLPSDAEPNPGGSSSPPDLTTVCFQTRRDAPTPSGTNPLHPNGFRGRSGIPREALDHPVDWGIESLRARHIRCGATGFGVWRLTPRGVRLQLLRTLVRLMRCRRRVAPSPRRCVMAWTATGFTILGVPYLLVVLLRVASPGPEALRTSGTASPPAPRCCWWWCWPTCWAPSTRGCSPARTSPSAATPSRRGARSARAACGARSRPARRRSRPGGTTAERSVLEPAVTAHPGDACPTRAACPRQRPEPRWCRLRPL